MKFETETGSLYELDADWTMIRRLEGVNNPTPRQGKDGEWKVFIKIVGPVVGENCIIFWDPETTPPLTELGGAPTTITSQVVAIHNA